MADAIRSGGLANSKAPRIQAILREVREREGAFDLSRLRDVPDADARDYLMSLPGIGPKTAAVVLSFALGRDAMPVDTHVHRVTKRLGLIPPKASAERADRLLHELIPDGLRTPMHVGLHPPRQGDLQGADASLPPLPVQGHLPDGASIPRSLKARATPHEAVSMRAGEGNRTPVSSLGSSRSAIEPHPRVPTGRVRRGTIVASA